MLLALLTIIHFQNGDTPLHLAARGGHTACVMCLLTTLGINLNIQNMVSWFTLLKYNLTIFQI